MPRKKVCGTCALWKPHLPKKPDLGGRCMWVSTEVWPASVIDIRPLKTVAYRSFNQGDEQ